MRTRTTATHESELQTVESTLEPAGQPTGHDIAEHLPLVQRMASTLMKRLPRSVQREDLVAAGTVGLLHALRSTSHTNAAMFAAYASIRIRGAMLDELRRHDWSPRRRKTPATADLSSASSTSNVSPIAARAGKSVPPPRPSVAVVGFDDLPLETLAALSQEGRSPLEEVLARRERDDLHAAVRQLPERERQIVIMRYFKGRPSKSIAVALRLSEARISQLHARATMRLKEILGATEELKLVA